MTIYSKDKTENFIIKANLVPIHQGKNYGYYESVYFGVYIPIKIYCSTCKEYFWQRPNDHLNGKGCPTCGHNRQQAESDRRKKLASETFIDKANSIHGFGRYGYIKTIYNKSNEHVCIICNECGSEFWQRPNDHLRGIGCPYCRESHGEKAIFLYLKENNIAFERQYSNNACRNIYPLPFDFVIYTNESKSEIKFLIEFQGIQNLKYTQTRDSIKFNYCKDNNIPLLIIPYTKQKLINQILEEFIAVHEAPTSDRSITIQE